MNRLRTGLKITLCMSAILAVLLLVIAEFRYEALFSAPKTDRSQINSQPSAILLIQPRKAAPFINALVDRNSPLPLPDWVVNTYLPYEAGILISDDESGQSIHIDAYTSLPRMSRFLTRELNQYQALDRIPDVHWDPKVAQNPEEGLILFEGTVPMDEGILNDVWLQWNQSIQPPPGVVWLPAALQ